MKPTTEELALLRTRPHATKLWLSIYQPQIVLACRVNNSSAAKGDRTITYDSVTSGSYINVISGMTMYVGKSPNSYDKGKIRVRSATSTTITIAENSEIKWEDDDYLTIVKFFEPWSIYPRIIQDPTDDEDVIFYKDYDIAYTNQNTILGSFINMGCHYAGFKNDPVYYTASGTINLKGEGLSYLWEFQGGTPTGSVAHTPGYVTYSSPGHYTTKLTATITGSSNYDVSYRHVSIYDRPGEGTNVPILSWELDDLAGSRDQGSYSGKIKIHQQVVEGTLRDDSLVVIFADDWYGSTKKSIGGNSMNRSSIVFVGYIVGGTIEYNWMEKSATFEVGSITEKMKNLPGFVIDVESKSSPSKWFELLDMDCRRAIYHYLKWHSTVLLCADFEFGGTDQKIQYYNSERSSTYDAIHEFMESTLVGSLMSDRQGKLYAEVNIGATNNVTGTFPLGISMNKSDWSEFFRIDEVHNRPLSYLEMGGIAYSGAGTGTFSALLTCAPGVAPSYEGSMDRREGLALQTQSQLNTLVGNVFAYENAKYPLVTMDMAGNYRNFDITPQEIIALNSEYTDNNRGLVWQNKHFHLIDINHSYNSEKEFLSTSISLHEVTQGFPGDTIIIPVEPPDDWEIPDPEIPNPPAPPDPPVPPDPPTEHPDTVFAIGAKQLVSGSSYIDSNIVMTLAKTTNFNDDTPNWVEMLPTDVTGTFQFRDYCVDPVDPENQGYWLCDSGLWKLYNLSQPNRDTVVAVNLLTPAEMYVLAQMALPSDYIRAGSLIINNVVAANDANWNVYVSVSALWDKAGHANRHRFIFRLPLYLGATWYPCAMLHTDHTKYSAYGDAGTIALTWHSPSSSAYDMYVWASRGYLDASGKAGIYKSTNYGASWSRIYMAGLNPTDYQVASDQEVYCVQNPSSDRGKIFVSNGGNNYTVRVYRWGDTTITPTYGGNDYGGNDLPYRRRKFAMTDTGYDAGHIAFVGKEAGTVNEPCRLFTSTDYGSTWTMKYYFGDRFKGGGLTMHPYTSSHLYIMGGDYNDDKHIQITSDGGTTWEEKEGDWESIFRVVPDYRSRVFAPGSYDCAGLIFPLWSSI